MVKISKIKHITKSGVVKRNPIKRNGILKLSKVPKGWIKTIGATTAPSGFAWYSNGESLFSSKRKYALVKINNFKRNSFDAGLIIKQLGGSKFIAMTGAKDFVKDDKKQLITFKIGRNSKSINYVRIKLNSIDTYNMDFLMIRAGKITVKSRAEGVFNEQLESVFNQHTGMNTLL